MSVHIAVFLFSAGFGIIFCGIVLVLGPAIHARIKDRREASPDYDRMINALIDGDLFEIEDQLTIRSGLLRVWVGNYPYSYGHPYGCGISQDLMLRAKTKKRLHDYVQRKSVLAALKKVRRA